MCGLVGIVDLAGRGEIDRALLGRMNDSQAHRGPDGNGLFTAPGIGLGHRRLSIIDRAGGAQPLFNEDRSVVVVYNGEIYNFQELSRTLEARGHVFRTHCDTEVIVHAWEEWGADCVTRFRGMFAFALWDAGAETLLLARDRLGIKPLYYARLADGTLGFGSELKSLMVHPALRRVIDASAVEDYFAYGYVPDPKSIYRDVKKLPPGHVLELRRGMAMAAPRRYWDVTFSSRPPAAESEICATLIDKLAEAVRIRLVAEVPLGAFLSGGVDSSAVVAMMARASGDPVNACSISFGDPAYDESRYAAAHAQRYGANHLVGRVDPDDCDLVDRLAELYDEPFADSSAIPTYRVCALARQRVVVALSGDGGDEVFAGYSRYRWHHAEAMARRALPFGLAGPLAGLLAGIWPDFDGMPGRLRARNTLAAIARDPASAYAHSVFVLGDESRGSLFSDGFRSELQGYNAAELIHHLMRSAPADDHLSRVQYTDLKTYLPGDILTKVDRASMAHSLEVRVPLLDHPLVEWAAGLPADLKLNGRVGKYVLKKALEPLVSGDILYRAKMGFAVPLAAWFRGPLKETVRREVTGPTLADTGMFDMANLSGLADAHQAGRADNSAALWALLMFASFLRRVHGVAPDSAPRASVPEVALGDA